MDKEVSPIPARLFGAQLTVRDPSPAALTQFSSACN